MLIAYLNLTTWLRPSVVSWPVLGWTFYLSHTIWIQSLRCDFQTSSKRLFELSKHCTEQISPFLFIPLDIWSAYFHQTTNNDGEYTSRVTPQICYFSSLVQLSIFLSISISDDSLTYITAKYWSCVACRHKLCIASQGCTNTDRQRALTTKFCAALGHVIPINFRHLKFQGGFYIPGKFVHPLLQCGCWFYPALQICAVLWLVPVLQGRVGPALETKSMNWLFKFSI